MTRLAPQVPLQLPIKLLPVLEPRRFKVLYGGRGGAKSHTVAQVLVMLSMQRKLRILCLREVQKSIRTSSKKVIEDYIERLGVGRYFEILRDEIRCLRTGSTFEFSGLKDHTADTVKSWEGVDIVWAEEAHSITARSWNILIPTIRKPRSEIWITFNPDQETDYVYDRFVKNTDPDALVIEINFEDNPWFGGEMDAERRKMKAANDDLYQHIWRGRCRSKAGVLFKRSWFNYYDVLPARLNKYIASDYAGEPDPENPESDPDYTEHGVWGVDEEFNLFAVDWWRGQTSPEEWIAQWMRLVRIHRPHVAFEEKGVILRALNGAINRRMQDERCFVLREGLASAGSKLERAYGFAALLQAGKVWLPKPEKAAWVSPLVEQLCAFHGQGNQHDDGVDVCSLVSRGLDEMIRARAAEAPKPLPPKPFTVAAIEAAERQNRMQKAEADRYAL